jgi:uncharacterized membrane protein YfcA
LTIDLMTLLALAGAGLLAGFVDAIAGGGGLIALPALLAAGVPPVVALGTNKVQSVIGTAVAALTYWRRGFVDLRTLLPAIVTAATAAFVGALVVRQIDPSALRIAVPIFLIIIAVYFLFAPQLTDNDSHARLRFATYVPLMAAVIGFHDGIFGPGTGSFLTMGFVALFGLGLTRASGHTKVLNLASNLGALILFIPVGAVLWPVAIAMAIGQVVGGYIGALTGIRFGARLIRPLVVVVCVVLALRLLLWP